MEVMVVVLAGGWILVVVVVLVVRLVVRREQGRRMGAVGIQREERLKVWSERFSQSLEVVVSERPCSIKRSMSSPAMKRVTPPTTPSVSTATPPSSSQHVLFVDDMELNRKMGKFMLSKLFDNSFIDTATDGLDAVTKARSKHYTLIFMDCMMPVMDGIEATKEIRRLPSYSTTPIIGVTACNLHQLCLQAGMNKVLYKPVLLDDFKKLISDLAISS